MGLAFIFPSFSSLQWEEILEYNMASYNVQYVLKFIYSIIVQI